MSRRQAKGAGDRSLIWAPGLTLALFLVPILAGLAGTALPAAGYLPAIGATRLSGAAWTALVQTPGLAGAIRLSLVTGIGTTLLSLGLALAILALVGTRRWVPAMAAPLLATPHVTLAIGLGFVIAPSGWLVRLAAGLVGIDRPPTWNTVHDRAGLALILGLTLKEVPYLVLMGLAALAQVPAGRMILIARTLGYGPVTAWVKLVLPLVYGQIRLPVYAVLAFSLSVVDVALVLGPSDPPTLAVLALRDLQSPDVSRYLPGAAAGVVQLGLVVAALGGWRLAERVLAGLGPYWIAAGARAGLIVPAVRVLGVAGAILVGLAGLSLAGLVIWSVALNWRFPAPWPDRLGLAEWARQMPALAGPASATLVLALASTAVALVLVLLCLENEQRRGLRPGGTALWLIYLPLLVPQIAFMFGLQVLLVRLNQDGGWVAVIWAHLLFVLPYVFLSLADPWRSLDPRYARSARALGAGPWRVWWRVKLPMLRRPLAAAAAIGIAISVGQYLPTLFAGNGGIATLTTEAVALAGGADRRVIAVDAVAQAAVPLAAFGLAALIGRGRR